MVGTPEEPGDEAVEVGERLRREGDGSGASWRGEVERVRRRLRFRGSFVDGVMLAGHSGRNMLAWLIEGRLRRSLEDCLVANSILEFMIEQGGVWKTGWRRRGRGVKVIELKV